MPSGSTSATAISPAVAMPSAVALRSDERLVLDGAAQRGERAAVARVAHTDPPVGLQEQVGVALVRVEDLDEPAGAVDRVDEVHRASPDAWAEPLDPAQVHPGALQRGDHVGAAGVGVGRAEGGDDDGPDEPPEGGRHDDVVGHVDARRDVGEADERWSTRPGSASRVEPRPDE
jgi:hypothetical protein